MHEALRHHTLLQLKTVGSPPPPGVGMGNGRMDPNTKFRTDGGGGTLLRNFLAGNRVVREFRDVTNNVDRMYSISVTTTTSPCPVETARNLWATKGPAYLEMFASPISAVQRLMAELLGAADEFRRLRISTNGDIDSDDDNTDNSVTQVRTIFILYIQFTIVKTS